MIDIVARATAPTAPKGARELGEGPFLEPGEQIDWHYRRGGWAPGDTSNIAPMRVVREDERGLVAWLALGTRLEIAGGPDGRRLRTVPLAQRWTVERSRIVEEWWGGGVLRIAPAGMPWSVWLFWSPGGDEWEFAGWYVNLENAHQRFEASTHSTDHVLDVEIESDGEIIMKDEDELVEAIRQGRLSADEGKQIEKHADAAISSFHAGDWPFDLEWTTWRPPSSWTVPELAELPENVGSSGLLTE